jgi:hypothetical protein
MRRVSFDYLVGTQQQCDRNIVADRMCSLEIDDELEIGRLLDRNVGRLDAPQRFDDHPRRLAEDARQASAISYQATFFCHFGPFVYGREPQLGGALENEAAVGDQQPRRQNVNRSGAGHFDLVHRRLDVLGRADGKNCELDAARSACILKCLELLLIGVGPYADRHTKLLIHLAVEGALLDAYSHCASAQGIVVSESSALSMPCTVDCSHRAIAMLSE